MSIFNCKAVILGLKSAAVNSWTKYKIQSREKKQHTGPVATHRYYMDSSDENNNNNNKATGVRHQELPLHFPFLILFLFLRQLHLEPAFGGVAVLLLVAFVIVPVARGVSALLALEGLLAGVPQHVAFQVHALVAAVAAHAALEGLGARVDALVPLEIGQVSTSVVAHTAFVGLLARVHAVVPLEVVEVGGGVIALRALIGLLAAVSLHVAGEMVGVLRDERTRRAGVQLVAFLRAARRAFGQHV